MPKRIQLSRKKGARLPADAVNCARPGPWGNPFKVSDTLTASDCVRLFRYLVAGEFCRLGESNPPALVSYFAHLKDHIEDLRGKDLACWCALEKPCHVDVLLEVANK